MKFRFSYQELFEGENGKKEKYKKSMERMFKLLHRFRAFDEADKEKFFGIKAGEGFDPQDIDEIMNSLCQTEGMDKKAKEQKIASLLNFFQEIQNGLNQKKGYDGDLDQSIIPFLERGDDPFQYPEINQELLGKYSN